MPAAAMAASAGEMVPAELQALVAPHIESYNYFVGEGLQEVVQRLDPVEVRPACLHSPYDTPRHLLQMSPCTNPSKAATIPSIAACGCLEDA